MIVQVKRKGKVSEVKDIVKGKKGVVIIVKEEVKRKGRVGEVKSK